MTENITNKKAYVNQANKQREEQSDLMKKWRIVKLLRTNFNIIALGMVDEFFFCRNRNTNTFMIERNLNETPTEDKHQLLATFQINKMDLFIKNHTPQRIIEIDGLQHGLFDEITETQQTTDRNANYNLGGYDEKKKNLIILTKYDMEKNDEELTQILASKLGVQK